MREDYTHFKALATDLLNGRGSAGFARLSPDDKTRFCKLLLASIEPATAREKLLAHVFLEAARLSQTRVFGRTP